MIKVCKGQIITSCVHLLLRRFCVLYARIPSKALNLVSVAYLMLATRYITPQLCDVRMLDCMHSLHDLIPGLCSLHHKQLGTGLICCLGLVLQSAESSLRDMQTLVQHDYI